VIVAYPIVFILLKTPLQASVTDRVRCFVSLQFAKLIHVFQPITGQIVPATLKQQH
jgi:hypothetical protein